MESDAMAKDTMAKEEKKTGRPPGTPNHKYDHVIVIPGQCQSCGSTEYSTKGLQGPLVQELDAIYTRADGFQYNRITRRRVRCESCGQMRFESWFEMVNTNGDGRSESE